MMDPTGPTDRERAIYHAVRVKGRPKLEIAREFGISELTVRDIALRTERKLARRQHELDRLCSTEALLFHLARLEAQWEESMEGWYRSIKDVYSEQVKLKRQALDNPDEIKRKALGDLLLTRRPQLGNVRYLEHARRLQGDMRAVEVLLDEREAAKENEDERLSLEQRRGQLFALVDSIVERARSEKDETAVEPPSDLARQVLSPPPVGDAAGLPRPEVP